VEVCSAEEEELFRVEDEEVLFNVEKEEKEEEEGNDMDPEGLEWEMMDPTESEEYNEEDDSPAMDGVWSTWTELFKIPGFEESVSWSALSTLAICTISPSLGLFWLDGIVFVIVAIGLITLSCIGVVVVVVVVESHVNGMDDFVDVTFAFIIFFVSFLSISSSSSSFSPSSSSSSSLSSSSVASFSSVSFRIDIVWLFWLPSTSSSSITSNDGFIVVLFVVVVVVVVVGFVFERFDELNSVCNFTLGFCIIKEVFEFNFDGLINDDDDDDDDDVLDGYVDDDDDDCFLGWIDLVIICDNCSCWCFFALILLFDIVGVVVVVVFDNGEIGHVASIGTEWKEEDDEEEQPKPKLPFDEEWKENAIYPTKNKKK